MPGVPPWGGVESGRRSDEPSHEHRPDRSDLLDPGHASAEAGSGAPELINQILRAATAAPPAANMYGWRFLVIRDQAIKNTVADRYRTRWYESDRPAFRAAAPSRVRYHQMLDACDHQADHLHEAPVWIVPCMLGRARTWEAGGGIYPAVQNILLAARALGLGATLTTMFQYEADAEAMLGLPDDL